MGLEDFEFVTDGCPWCFRKKLAILLFNAGAFPEDWISILDDDSGDPRLIKIKNLYGTLAPAIVAGTRVGKEYAPTGFAGKTVHNSVRDAIHFYHWLKKVKGYE